MDTFRLHHAGIDGVDTNLARPELLGQRPRYCIDRPFGAAVNRGIGKRERTGNRTDIDDASACGTEQLQRRLRRADEAENIQVELLSEMLLRDVLERREFIDASVVHEDIEPAEGLLGLGEQAINV